MTESYLRYRLEALNRALAWWNTCCSALGKLFFPPSMSIWTSSHAIFYRLHKWRLRLLKIDARLTFGVDSNAHVSLLFSNLQIIRELCKSVTSKTGKVSCSQLKIFFSFRFFFFLIKRKHIKRHFSTCLLQARKAEMVSRENKAEGLFLLTIALSYKFSLNPQPPLTVEFPLFLAFSFAPPPFFFSLSCFSTLSAS